MKIVGNFQFDKSNKIGEGAFGKVYIGHNKTESNKIAAIKSINTRKHKSNSFPDSINRETHILQTLSNPTHRNIVNLFYYEQQGTRAFFVMEFCNGGNLQEYLTSKGNLDERTLIIFLRQIAAGLKAAHDMHIVHRDLKPANILLCFSGSKYPDSNDITLKIADFGVGRFLDDKKMAHTYCGTPLYMAPEILAWRLYDYKVDLWSVGVIAFECIVGSLPSTERPMATQDFEIPKNISADLANLVKGLLEKDETRRFDMKQFLNHSFLSKTISVTVVGSSQQHRTTQIKENARVDDLIDKVCDIFALGKDSGNVYLVHEGRSLERGSGDSLKDAGIIHNSTITFGMKVSGGRNSDLDGCYL